MGVAFYALENMSAVSEPFHSLAVILMTAANQIAVIAPLLLVFNFFLNEVPRLVKNGIILLGVLNAVIHLLFCIHVEQPAYFRFWCQLNPLVAYLISCISALFLYRNEQYEIKKKVAKPFWAATMITLPVIATIGFSDIPKESHLLWIVWTIRPLFYVIMSILFVRYRHELSDLFPKKEKKKKLDIQCFADQFGLTNREKELTVLLVKGFKNREMANLVGLKEKSIENHLTRIYRKCEVATRVELMHLTMTHDEA